VPLLALGEEPVALLDDGRERAALLPGQAAEEVGGDLARERGRRVLARALDEGAREDERALVVQLRGGRRFGRADLLLEARLRAEKRRRARVSRAVRAREGRREDEAGAPR